MSAKGLGKFHLQLEIFRHLVPWFRMELKTQSGKGLCDQFLDLREVGFSSRDGFWFIRLFDPSVTCIKMGC